MAWLRELVHRTLRDAVPLNATVKSEIAATLGLSGSYQEIWNTFSILLLDNFRLSTSQKGSIQRLLTLTPFPLYASLSCISVRDFLGTSLVDIPLLINSGDLSNVSATEVGSVLQNQFPVDISSRTIDIFSAVATHEVNHIVDFHTVRPSAKLSARENALIAAAGVDSMNYCRSMFSPGVFISSPQEFFASLSNEWFADSRNTLNLAVKRFKGGRPQPLNQFVFFADVYSQGSDTTLFYTLDAQGILARTSVKLHRNASSFIDALVLPDSTFTLAVDGSGNVSNLSMSKTTAIEISAGGGIPTALQLFQNYPNPFNPSTTIRFQLPKGARVSLEIFNVLGQQIALLVDRKMDPGYHQVQWDAAVSSGIYFYRLQAGEFLETKKMILLR